MFISEGIVGGGRDAGRPPSTEEPAPEVSADGGGLEKAPEGADAAPVKRKGGVKGAKGGGGGGGCAGVGRCMCAG